MKNFLISLAVLMLCGISVSAQSTLGGQYQVITSTSDFVAGDTIILVSYDADKNVYVMGTYDNDTGNAFYAINIGTTTEEYLPSTITLDAANTNGNAYEYRARIYRDDYGNIETIAPQDINSKYVSSDNDDTNTKLYLDDYAKKWTPVNLYNTDSDIYKYNAVSFKLGNNKFIGYSSGCFRKRRLGTSGYTFAYCYKKISSRTTLSIGDTGYATMYYSDRDVKLPEGLTAYSVNVTKEGGNYKLNLNRIASSVRHDTGVLLHGTPNTDYYPTIYSTEATAANNWQAVAGNMLYGTDTDEEQSNGSGNYFKLAKHDTKGLGFYWGADNGVAFKNKAHKAYLFLPDELLQSSLSALPFSLIENGSTSIDIAKEKETVMPQTVTQRYDISGRKSNDTSINGIYITNGKKIISE